MITKVNNHSPFTVKKDELKSGAAWNKVAQDRFIKQHGDIDHIPEGDSHAVPTQIQGPGLPSHSTEEMQVAVSNLEEQIKKLQEKEMNQPAPVPAPKEEKKDDFYDDWLNE